MKEKTKVEKHWEERFDKKDLDPDFMHPAREVGIKEIKLFSVIENKAISNNKI